MPDNDLGDLQMASWPCHIPLRQPQDGSASGHTQQDIQLEQKQFFSEQ